MDFRNYKVSSTKASKVLSFHPKDDVKAIVADLAQNMHRFSDWDNPNYYNIQVFKNRESVESSEVAVAVGAAAR
jgi:hypothetical protein